MEERKAGRDKRKEGIGRGRREEGGGRRKEGGGRREWALMGRGRRKQRRAGKEEGADGAGVVSLTSRIEQSCKRRTSASFTDDERLTVSTRRTTYIQAMKKRETRLKSFRCGATPSSTASIPLHIGRSQPSPEDTT